MSGIGSSNLLKHKAGRRLTATQAIQAKCADCTGDYADGRKDCEMNECPLYPWMPYGTNPREKSKARSKAAKQTQIRRKNK